MPIQLKRVYARPAPADGYRVLVDRIWPRGVSKDAARLDEWMKPLAPSNLLRKAFHAGDLSWGEFRRRYLSELKGHRDHLRQLAQRSRSGRVTLVFSARDPEHNNAVVVKQYLRMLGAG
jgi:uncharacterized protein YeaO (DUF488 family)